MFIYGHVIESLLETASRAAVEQVTIEFPEKVLLTLMRRLWLRERGNP